MNDGAKVLAAWDAAEGLIFAGALTFIVGFGSGVLAVLMVQDQPKPVELTPAAEPQPARLQLSCDKAGREEFARVCRARKRLSEVR